MKDEFVEQLTPSRLSCVVYNNLHHFNDKPKCVEVILEKMQKLADLDKPHTHEKIYEKALSYYADHKTFPDMKWLLTALPSKAMEQYNIDNFSTHIYNDLLKLLDESITKGEIDLCIVSGKDLKTEDYQKAISILTKQALKNKVSERVTAENAYDKIIASHKERVGCTTGIKELDEVIRIIPKKNITVLAGTQGGGKTTTANSIAYNAVVNEGKCVDYVTLEEGSIELWGSIAAIESYYNKEELQFGNIRDGVFEEGELGQFKRATETFKAKSKTSGGLLNIMDSGCFASDTFEGMCMELEEEASKRGRPADMIIISTVNCFEKFTSYERDSKQKVNSMIIHLESFSQKYSGGLGTAILLLAQVNREGLTKLVEAQEENVDKKKVKKTVTINGNILAEYNQLDRKASTIIACYSDATLRGLNILLMYCLKVRSRSCPPEPLKLSALFKCSLVGNGFTRQTHSEGFADACLAVNTDSDSISDDELEQMLLLNSGEFVKEDDEDE